MDPIIGRGLKGVAAVTAAVLVLMAGFWMGYLSSQFQLGQDTVSAAGDLAQPASGSTPVAYPTTNPGRNFAALETKVTQLFRDAGARGAVTLVELDAKNPSSWSKNGDQQFTAASTYKLPLLMLESQNVTTGRWRTGDRLCFDDKDYEDGWYSDYEDGECFARQELERRAGKNSDNTAARILVRYAGGSSQLNAYARSHGARSSIFFTPNTTTSNDLARLWVDEVAGRAGGRPAQQYLYGLLTGTSYEQGIPAGIPKRGVRVPHKIGILGTVLNDAALIESGPQGAYVLIVMSDGVGANAAGWRLHAEISRAVWQYESSR